MLKVSNKGLVLDICSGTGNESYKLQLDFPVGTLNSRRSPFISGTIALALYQQLVKSAVGTERHILRFIGIEMIPEAVDSAILNARINGVDEKAVTFVCGKAEEVLPTVLGSIADDTEVFAIVDPPRAGLRKYFYVDNSQRLGIAASYLDELGPEIDLINEKCLIFGFGVKRRGSIFCDALLHTFCEHFFFLLDPTVCSCLSNCSQISKQIASK